MNNEEKMNETNTNEELFENADAVSKNPFAQTKEELTEEINGKDGVPADSKLKEDYEKLNNQYLRLAADFDNYRKRQAQEKEIWMRYGMEESLTKMIDVLDSFDRASKSCEQIEDITKVKECFTVLEKQVKDALSKIGLTEIETKGVEFDPNFHEAIMQTASAEHKENEIVNVLQKGYMYQQKVLRPARVSVATGE